MQRVGIGAALLFDVTQNLPHGRVRFGSDEWHALFKHAVSEANRLGLLLIVNNDAGWTGSGGPWVTPEHSMLQFVSVKTNVSGPAHFHGQLPALRKSPGFSGDIATLAFPTLVGDGVPVPGFAPTISASTRLANPRNLVDHNPATSVTLPLPKPGKPQYLQLHFEEPFTAHHFTLGLRLPANTKNASLEGRVEASEDGRKFRPIRQFLSRGSEVSVDFEQVSARFFRIVLERADGSLPGLDLTDIELTPVYRIPHNTLKSGAGRGKWPSTNFPTIPVYATIARSNIINLTSQVRGGAELSWEVPAGQWTIMRFGYVPVGTENHPAAPEGLGLECDKLSKEAISEHFSGFLEKLIADAGPLAGHAFSGTHIDSWEIGFQNWTPRFLEEFRTRRGYDALPYLPACSGRYVESAEISERFLWDVRRTVADLVADNYAGGLADLAHQYGLTLSIQAYAIGPFDNLPYAGRADQPAAEFWTEADDFGRFQTSKLMSSAAHTYGKNIVDAEAFTAYPANSFWQNHPFSLKPLGDGAFASGVNRFFIHRFAHQPWTNREPGMTMGPWGLNYDRTCTWWEQSRTWHEYLARCQFMLQRGTFVADICYLTEEGSYTDVPDIRRLESALPDGFDFDFISPEVVLGRLTFSKGRLRLPDGMSYRVLVLPNTQTMTPELLAKLKSLVEAGATIIGRKPGRSPSLHDYPACDARVQELVDALWADCDGLKVKEHRFGQGKITFGRNLSEILADCALLPDFQVLSKVDGYPLRYVHRHEGDAEIYFIANSNAHPVTAQCAFRVDAKQPELWRPDSGEQVRLAAWREDLGRTLLDLRLDASGSVFVVFRPAKQPIQSVTELLHDGKPQFTGALHRDAQNQLHQLVAEAGRYELRTASNRKLRVEVRDLPAPLALSGPWEISFQTNRGGPNRVRFDSLVSWTASSDPRIKYFSGKAVYRKAVSIPQDFKKANRHILLDLGNVQVIAEVKVNGQDLGTFWKPPFVADITPATRAGTNLFEIIVVNCWVNRLIGDEQLPDDCTWRPGTQNDALGRPIAEWPTWLQTDVPRPSQRITFTSWKYLKKDSPLLESGLLGPVVLRAADELTFSD